MPPIQVGMPSIQSGDASNTEWESLQYRVGMPPIQSGDASNTEWGCLQYKWGCLRYRVGMPPIQSGKASNTEWGCLQYRVEMPPIQNGNASNTEWGCRQVGMPSSGDAANTEWGCLNTELGPLMQVHAGVYAACRPTLKNAKANGGACISAESGICKGKGMQWSDVISLTHSMVLHLTWRPLINS